jgi:hypothetical protein
MLTPDRKTAFKGDPRMLTLTKRNALGITYGAGRTGGGGDPRILTLGL